MFNLSNFSFVNKLSDLLRACADWVRQRRLFGASADKTDKGLLSYPHPNPEGFSWVFDPRNKTWLLEANYSYRSFECRIRAGEAQTPPGIQSVRRILRDAH